MLSSNNLPDLIGVRVPGIEEGFAPVGPGMFETQICITVAAEHMVAGLDLASDPPVIKWVDCRPEIFCQSRSEKSPGGIHPESESRVQPSQLSGDPQCASPAAKEVCPQKTNIRECTGMVIADGTEGAGNDKSGSMVHSLWI